MCSYQTAGTDRFTAVAISPDGSRAVAGHHDGRLDVIDFPSWRVVGSLPPSSLGVDALVFDRRGRRIASASANGVVEVWDVASGERTFHGAGASHTRALAFSDDDSRLAATGDEGTTVWDVATLRVVGRFAGGAHTVAFADDGVHVIAGQRWSLHTGEGDPLFPGSNATAPTSCAFATQLEPHGRMLVVEGALQLALRRADDGTLLRAFRGGVEPVLDVSASADGLRAVDGSPSGVDVWDLATASRMFEAPHAHAPSSMSLDGKLVVANDDNDLLVLDAGSGGLRARLSSRRPAGLPVATDYTALGLLGDRDVVAIQNVGDHANVVLWDFARGALRQATLATRAGAAKLSTSRRLAVLDGELWDLVRGRRVASLETPTGFDRSYAFSRDDRYVFGVGQASVDAFETLSGGRAQSMGFPAAGLWTGNGSVPTAERDSALALSPDAQRALFGSDEGTITVWDLQRAAPLRRLVGHTGRVTSLSFVRDGEYALSGSEDGTMRLWRLATGASIAMVAHEGEWVVYDDEGYFDASRHGGALVAAVHDLHAYGIDRLAIRNNRPDILLAHMGLAGSDVVAYFEKRHEARLQKLGLDETVLTDALDRAPEAHIVSVDVTGSRARRAGFDRPPGIPASRERLCQWRPHGSGRDRGPGDAPASRGRRRSGVGAQPHRSKRDRSRWGGVAS
jgi:WD40 repeat protein